MGGKIRNEEWECSGIQSQEKIACEQYTTKSIVIFQSNLIDFSQSNLIDFLYTVFLTKAKILSLIKGSTP